jgi:hypothetical protein
MRPLDRSFVRIASMSRVAGCAVLLTCALFAACNAETTSDKSKSKAAVPVPAAPPTKYLPDRFAGAAGRYYRVIWGIDGLSVKTVESGEIIRFTWRVLDADKASALNDKRAVPALNDPQAGVSLVVPTMEQIGQLRQSIPPEAGKSYWMAFSNKGRVVKKGDRVDVVIGQFRADGLVVD